MKKVLALVMVLLVTLTIFPLAAFAAGSNVKCSLAEAKKPQVEWEKVSGAQAYVIYRQSSNSNWTKIKTIMDGDTTEFVDQELSANTKYRYGVRSAKKTGGKWQYISTELSNVILTGYSAADYNALAAKITALEEKLKELEGPRIDTGKVLYEDEFVTIAFDKIQESKYSYYACDAVFIVTNKTDYELTFQSDAISFNGISYEVSVSDEIAPNSTGRIYCSSQENIPSNITSTSGAITVIDWERNGGAFPDYSYDAKWTGK